MAQTVLVTGGSGFIGAWCIVKLLEQGYAVRTTVRSLTREAEVRGMVKAGIVAGGVDAGDKLTFAVADLMSDAGWAEAAANCDFVLHVASPFPMGAPKHEDDLIVPAREGALRVLKAARDAGVKRVVLTSSLAAIGYGHAATTKTFTETDWSNPDGPHISAYAKSKTLAEKAAWDFIAREGGALELSVVNPVGVFGPVLGPDHSTSIEVVQRMLDGAVPGLPNIYFGVVDVRDVADMHLSAMTSPAAKGERFLAVAGDSVSLPAMAKVIKARLGAAAAKVPSRTLPDWLVRLIALFNPEIALIAPELGNPKNASNEKARRLLGWAPRSNEDAIIATAESLLAERAATH